ncbi:MAG: RNA-binding S4 domain-containing protein [Acidobacteria bacterium]|nr:RNA-binding S4 domain-containing protein [Acidobacteriota bacterium]
MDQEKVRLDRWLVAVRLFKTRALSAEAISGGKVKVNDESAKPHKSIRIGDVVTLKRDGQTCAYTVMKAIEKRVSASDAIQCYQLEVDPGLDLDQKQMLQTIRDLARLQPKSKGRPSKRDRRVMQRFKEHIE